MSSNPVKSKRLASAPALSTTARVFGLIIIMLLTWGWMNKDENYLTAEEGLGYTLGIVGGSLMLLLLLYPVRKKLKAWRNWAPIRYWFQIHMMFGILGPVAIIFHSGFGFGSMNSNIAMVCMLVVSGSGLFGRYFYTKIHYGLYGELAGLKELKQQTESSRIGFEPIFAVAPHLEEHLHTFERDTLAPSKNFIHGAFRLLSLGSRIRRQHKKIRKEIKLALHEANADKSRREKKRINAQAQLHLDDYFVTLRKAAEFKFYEKMFALWHLMHLPLFFMLVITGIFHVIAVHYY